MEFNHKNNAKVLFTKEKIGQYWNDLYKHVATCLDYHFILRLESSAKIITENFPKDAKILDLGCGAGVLSERLLAAGFSVDAADMSADMRELTTQRLAKFDANKYKIFHAECEKLEIADSTYDLVACIGVFGYIDDVDKALSEINRVLKPGGTFIMSIRNEDNRNIFDLANLFKFVFYKLPRKILKTLTPTKAPHTSNPSGPGTATPIANKFFIDIFDRPKDVIKLINQFNFSATEFYGLGYGPLQFNGKTLLPETMAKGMSRMLSSVVRVCRLEKFTKWVADISIYVFKKH